MLTEISIAIAIVFVCLLLHVTGIMLIAEWMVRHQHYFDGPGARIHFSIMMVILYSGIVLLHIVETTLWATFYYSSALFQDFETALYFSFVSYTTIGYGDVLLPHKWRLLGALEGMSGVLLCGLSTAFIFATIYAMFKSRIRPQAQWHSKAGTHQTL
jgi:voltage-gated potassium channel